MADHTPTPWKVGDLKQWSIETNARAIIAEGSFAVAWAPGWAVSDETSVAAPDEAAANAALIVRAVNCHATLTKALTQILELVGLCTRQASFEIDDAKAIQDCARAALQEAGHD